MKNDKAHPHSVIDQLSDLLNNCQIASDKSNLDKINLKKTNPLISREWADKPYVIYNPPVNSSGDVYHIAAYLILCEHYNWYMPNIYLGYDTAETEKQAQRAQNFLELLNLKSKIVNLNSSLDVKIVAHANVRLSKMRDILKKEGYIGVDQKMTTAFINAACQIFGKEVVLNIIKVGFLTKPWRSIEPEQAVKINTWLDNTIIKFKQNRQKKQFIMIHNRASSCTNSNQNFSGKQLKAIYEALPDSIEMVVVNTQMSYLCSSFDRNILQVNAFGDVPGLKKHYEKFAHLQLVNAVSQMPGFIGALGNTSGTFDAVAFLGIKTFNCHKFAEQSDKKSLKLPYQDYRILIQSCWMTVCSTQEMHEVDEKILGPTKQEFEEFIKDAQLSEDEKDITIKKYIKEFKQEMVGKQITYRLKNWMENTNTVFPQYDYQRLVACSDSHNDRIPFGKAHNNDSKLTFNHYYNLQDNQINVMARLGKKLANVKLEPQLINSPNASKSLANELEYNHLSNSYLKQRDKISKFL